MNERNQRHRALQPWAMGLAILLVLTGAIVVAQASVTSSEDSAATAVTPAAEPATATIEPGSGCDRCARHQRSETPAKQGCPGRSANQDRQQGPHAGARSHGRGSSGGQRPEMELAHFLVANHDRVTRRVEILDNGVRTTTTTEDPDLVEALRSHVRQMADLLQGEGRIRNWDPVFREIFDHREAIELEISDIDNGVEVVEVSPDPSVARLIQAHARKVDEFVDRGQDACHEGTPLPDDYPETGS